MRCDAMRCDAMRCCGIADHFHPAPLAAPEDRCACCKLCRMRCSCGALMGSSCNVAQSHARASA
eukprot:1019785-Amphidinium_carterae.1